MKKGKFSKKLRHLRITVLTGLLLFGISSVVSFTGWHTFGIIGLTGIINENNRTFLWLATLFILFVFAGEIVDFLLRHIFKKKSEKLIDAMKKVSDGEFSVRLKNGKKITDTGLHTVHTFNNMAEQLQNLDTLNKDFAGNFSHELKTPLGTISGFAKILKDTELSAEEKHEYLDIIIEESERLSRLSNNILMLSKLEKQTEIVNTTEYDLTEQLRQTVAFMYQKCNTKNIGIVFDGEEHTISANRELLAQVWINLLDNAIKFSPENESIYINVIKNADCAAVSIKNYGNTLSEEELSHIFDKFYQGTGEKKALGNGLGLTMVKKIIELHGGSISVALSDNCGITFSVNIP